MCPPKDPPKVKNIIPEPIQAPEKAPDPVPVAPPKDGDSKRRGRSSLRIDLAAGSPRSGVSV